MQAKLRDVCHGVGRLIEKLQFLARLIHPAFRETRSTRAIVLIDNPSLFLAGRPRKR